MQTLDSLDIRARQTIKNYLQLHHEHIQGLSRQLASVSPLATLARGYAIVRDDAGKIVKSIKKVKQNDMLTIHVSDGNIISQVTKLQDKDT